MRGLGLSSEASERGREDRTTAFRPAFLSTFSPFPCYRPRMPALIIVGSILVFALAMWAGTRAARAQRRHRLRSKPFPAEWLDILHRNFPMYEHLPAATQKQLQGHTQVFLAEKNFEGCAGLELTDEMKVTIAAQASFLLLSGKCSYYPRLHSILVYPSTYVARSEHMDGAGDSSRLGESWTTGAVVLAWDATRRGGMDMKDGHNVVFHEFAHQLDQDDGLADGAPKLENLSRYAPWARVLSKEYYALQKRAGSGRKSVMDDYGATDPAEFFAVATETFFEKPAQMKEKHPDLYEELKEYYELDPGEWE